MQPQNQPPRNNPWGFQASNWSRPATRGPPPQHHGPDMSRFGLPSGSRNMRPDFAANHFGQNSRCTNPPPSYGQPRMLNNPSMSNNQRQNPNAFQQRPRHEWQQGPQSNQAPFFNGNHGNNMQHRPPGPRFNQAPMCNRPQSHQGPMGNRPPNRPIGGQRPEFFRAPGGFNQRPRFQHDRQHGEKKKKVNKKDLPENNKFYCDVCDKGYKDEDKYRLHCDLHEKCPKEGCSYIAAGKLVQLHIKLQHNSGMAKKIWSLESKEDIQKWIDERKKNFPTAENIEKKKAQLAERIARGEVIEEKYFGKMHRRENNKGQGRDRGRGRGRRGQDRQNMKRKNEDAGTGECTDEKQSKVDGDDDKESSKKLEAAESLGIFFAAADSSSDSSSSEDEDDNNSKEKQSTGTANTTVPEVTAAGALNSLMTSYIESDGSDDEGAPDSKSSKMSPEKNEVSIQRSGDGTERGDGNEHGKKPQRQRGKQRRNKNKWAPPPKLDKSLLEKLLAKEIRQERNKIMQCVHHIVKNNFFDNVKSNEEIKS